MAAFKKMLIIGCGNMGGAMLAGWLAAGVPASRFEVLDRNMDNPPAGVVVHRSLPDRAGYDSVMLGFKPQQLTASAPDLQVVTQGKTVFSLLAGIEVSMLAEAFPDAAAHVRVMPNLASRIGKSPVILTGDGLDGADRAQAKALFDHLGTAVWLDDESKFDLVTALAGSGPGFVYRFIDALSGAAQELGLDAEMADPLAFSMVEGASQLAAGSDVPPAQLADRVASPGGMTREGLDVLDADDALKNLLIATLRATADRGGALAQASRNHR
ncbi:MAG: pyrroline-5-carboxylate reductase [Erythrobacter sp.]